MSDETPAYKRKRERSPAYPGIDLAKALERVQELYNAEGRSPAHINAVLEDWGYSPGSGRGLVTLAALKHFGLLTDEGSGERRQARLSPLALKSLLSEEGSEDRREAIQEAALIPKIHRELWEKYEGVLPSSDAALRSYLGLERKFTDRALRRFIPQFRSTVAFAGLDAEEHHGSDSGEDDQIESGSLSSSPGVQRHGAGVSEQKVRDIQLPISQSSWVTVRGPFPLSEKAWTRMLAMLGAMKPGLTVAAETPQDDDEEDVT